MYYPDATKGGTIQPVVDCRKTKNGSSAVNNTNPSKQWLDIRHTTAMSLERAQRFLAASIPISQTPSTMSHPGVQTDDPSTPVQLLKSHEQFKVHPFWHSPPAGRFV
jgi:hypothetical protein